MGFIVNPCQIPTFQDIVHTLYFYNIIKYYTVILLHTTSHIVTLSWVDAL